MDGQVRLRTDRVVWQEVDGEAVVLDLERSTYLTVNGTGVLLWRLLAADEATEPAMVDALTQAYSIDRDQAERDVDAFLSDLAERGLVERG